MAHKLREGVCHAPVVERQGPTRFCRRSPITRRSDAGGKGTGGHQDLTMTQPYSHLRPAALVDIILETLQRAR